MLTFAILLLGTGAIFEGERDRNVTLFITDILHSPNEHSTGQRTILVVVGYDRRHLTAYQFDAVLGQIDFRPSAWIQTGVIALGRIKIGFPCRQRMLGATAKEQYR